jgi:hypothetical protein
MHAPDMPKLERPNIEMPDIDVSMSDITKSVGKAVTGAAVAVGLVRPARPRWPFVIAAAIIAGLTAWALMHSTTFRDRLDRAARTARLRMDEMRESHDDMDETDAVAFTAAETMPIDESYLENGKADVAGALDAADATANDYPEGFGATTDLMGAAEDGTPAFEATRSPR